jgi:hypothetical protein
MLDIRHTFPSVGASVDIVGGFVISPKEEDIKRLIIKSLSP